MTADISSTLNAWSTTESSNSPSGSTSISTNLDDNLRMIQAVVRNLASTNTIASATTTDLSTINETFITVSGTTTITGLGTLTAGIYKVLIFSGALTLTHNATSLILPDAANVTTTAGDVFIMLSEGSGNWRCVGTTQITAMAGYTTLYNLVVANANNGYTPTIITGNTTLTSSSNKYIISRASGACTITLPDATTLSAQHDCYVIENQALDNVSSSVLKIANDTGTIIYYLGPGTTARFSLNSITDADGPWIEQLNQGTRVTTYPSQHLSATATNAYGADVIDDSHILTVRTEGANTIVSVLEMKGGGFDEIQTLTVDTATMTFCDICVLDSTTALVVHSKDSTLHTVDEITITASTYALASAGSATTGAASGTNHYCRIEKVSTTTAVMVYNESTTASKSVIVTATGGAPTFGTTGDFTNESTKKHPDLTVLSTTVALACYVKDDTSDTVNVYKINISGANVSSVSSASATFYAGSSFNVPIIKKMSATSAILLYEDNGSPKYSWINASSTPTIGTGVLIEDADDTTGKFINSAPIAIEQVGGSSSLYLIQERYRGYSLVEIVDTVSFKIIAQVDEYFGLPGEGPTDDCPPRITRLYDSKLACIGTAQGASGNYPAVQLITTNHAG